MSALASVAADEALLQAFSDSVATRMGLHFPPERWPELWRGCCAWAEAEGGDDVADRMRRWIAAAPQRSGIQALATQLAVGETYFFREPACFDALRQRILPPLIAERRRAGHKRLRLWSAGCASGEEAYSIAIVVSELIPDLRDWDVRILATDIHPGLLALARGAIYGDWSFRAEPVVPNMAHFERLDAARWQLRPALRALVDIAHLNLADADAWHGVEAMDVVLCRHVLMYFEPLQAEQLVRRLHAVLAESGWLVTAAIESRRGATFSRRHDLPAAPTPTPTPTPTPIAVVPRAALPDAAPAVPERERLEEILGHCRSALLADRCNAELHQLQALVHEELGQLDAARVALRRALFLEPGCVVAHLALGRLLERQGLRDQASRRTATALELLRRRALAPTHAATAGEAVVAELIERLQDPVA